MAEASIVDAGAPNLNLSPEEKRVFGQLFRAADTENIGVVTGEIAVKFFERTRLEPRVLGEIWQIADKENRGLLTPAGFGIALRLIGHYQAGRNPTPELAYQSGPLPKFDDLPPIQPPPGPHPSALQPQTSGPVRVPPLTPDKVNQYAALFEKSGAQNGVLPGEQAKQIFERAGLPNEILGRIWNLADTEQRGALMTTEFIVAMHLIASSKSGALRGLPAQLPAGLYEAAARRAPPRQMSSSSSISAIPRQFSGSGAVRTGSPLGRPPFGPPSMGPQTTGQGGDWAISPADKQRFDGIFSGLDKGNRGFITGDEAVPFFSNSKLSEDVLAQIWDLADINSQGFLTRDEFAVAMYLIRQQRSKRDGRDNLPATLPQNLIPPSMRNQVRPPAQPTAPAFETNAPSIPKSAADDLFGLDALASPAPPAPTQAPLSTGGSTGIADPFGGDNRTPLTPSSPAGSSPRIPTGFKPFVPSSSFGQSLTHQGTGASSASAPPAKQITPQPSAMDDLLGDNDPEISKKLTNETTELANLSNQVGSLSKQMQDVQSQRSTTQIELNQATSQKREFELRLSQLRSLYEQEVKDVKGLEERLNMSRNESKKLQQEIAMIEGSYADLQTQHRNTVTALQADQQENANLKERMRVINSEISDLKPQLEKLRLEARQQKGLVAINKKQLLTNEGERDKMKTEIDELTKSNEESARAIAAASQVQSPAPVTSPALSTMSANNPFFRRQGSSSEISSSPFSQSPAPAASFDNVFGPSFDAAVASQESSAPPTTFMQSLENPESTSNPPAGLAILSVDSDVTSPTDASVPPALSESRQISSSILPFSAQAAESLSSSRQVSAPTSRFGEGSQTPTTVGGDTLAASQVTGETEPPSTSPEQRKPSAAEPSAYKTAPDAKESIPGAFPGDVNSHLAATPTGGSALSEGSAKDSTDSFAINKELPRAPTGGKADFDAAFAGFGGSSKRQDTLGLAGSSSGAGNVNTEFPPLQELDNDEESESDGDAGFDDDFTSASPGHSRKESALDRQGSGSAGAPELASGLLEPRPAVQHLASAASVGTNPPTPGAQASPPPYDKTVSPHDKAHAEVDQYAGLLPMREDPTSPPQHVDHAVDNPPTSGQSLFSAPAPITSNQPPAPPAKAPFDDFDNEFDDLEDAKEGDADDDFANISAHDRSVIDDFNPVFDSPVASKPIDQSIPQNNTGFGTKNGFGQFTQSPTQSQAPAPAPAAPADNHDWDAIFAGLDSTPSVSNTVGVNLPHQDDEITPAPPLNGTTTSFPKPAAPSPERPAIGRALTEQGLHDDPILKSLTSMGYARKDALSALEKYDYNLERAANHLASQS